MKKLKQNLKDTFRGVVHIGQCGPGYEFTLCGLAWDEPCSEWGAETMEDTDAVCTCPDCYHILNELLPKLQRESKRMERKFKREKKHEKPREV